METHPDQVLPVEMSVIDERLSVAARIGNAIRGSYEHARDNIKTYAAIGAASLALSGAELATATEPAAAEKPPAASLRRPVINSYKMGVGKAVEVQDGGINYLSSTSIFNTENSTGTGLAQFSSMDPICVEAGLVLPTVKDAFMLRPGKKPWAKSPTHSGPTQEVRLTAEYQPMPEDDLATPEVEGCPDYRRIGQVMLQKRVGPNEDENDHKNDGWATMDFWSWIYSRDQGGPGGLIATPNGHEGNWYYEKLGQKVRAQFRNLVRYLPTGETITSKIKTALVVVRWPRRHTPRN